MTENETGKNLSGAKDRAKVQKQLVFLLENCIYGFVSKEHRHYSNSVQLQFQSCFIPLTPQQLANSDIFLFTEEQDGIFIHL